MGLAAGTRLGPYEITTLLGAGGMGEVYRARDTRLKRDVAVKILPGDLSGDPEREARFAREAEALAALNHPNIATIYGFEEAGGARCLLMELIEGDTLADRLRAGPLPTAEALETAKQICEGLEAAHEHGIAHRDLKPANINVTPSGRVKLLDFGLARMLDADDSPTLTNSPTVMGPTVAGVILGTAAYMSPEQAKGGRGDRQSDVWAFGCVLYEMLTGTRAFHGNTVVEILSETLKADPDWAALPETTPPAVRSLLKRCLKKDRNRRMRDIADARFQIEEALIEGMADASVAAVSQPRKRTSWAAALIGLPPLWAYRLIALLVVSLAAVAAGLYLRRTPVLVDPPEIRVQIVAPEGSDLTRFALSPDGRKIVFVARNQLWLRSLDSETEQSARPLQGTGGAGSPFWSPDSLSIGFVANNELKRIEVTGAAPRVLLGAVNALGATWGPDGSILFTRQNTGPIYRVPAGGGEAVVATRVNPPGITGHWHPFFLPDGRHFLMFGLGTPEQKGVYLGSLDSTDTRRLFDADAEAVFAPPDLVLFPRQGALLAQRLDSKTWEPVGTPSTVAGRVAVDFVTCGCTAVSSSAAGPIAYRAGGREQQLVWVDRSGQQLEMVGAPDTATPRHFQPSPDDRRVAMARTVGAYQDLWLMETARGVLQRFTSGAANKLFPVWSPDGRRIVFAWDPKGVLDLYEKSMDEAGNGTLLWSSAESKIPSDWSLDGRFVLYGSQTDLWALPLDGDKKPVEVARTAFSELNGRFSPDGGAVVYQSNETGRNEIYVQSFPTARGKKQITNGGGASPQWNHDGREIYYLAGGRVMAVPVTMNAEGIDVRTPIALFNLPVGEGTFTASRDGRRFLVSKIVQEAPPVTLLLNWKPAR